VPEAAGAAAGGPLPTIAVCGLGKLGACLAAVFAASGFPVVGADVDPVRVRGLAALEPPVDEPGLGEALRAAAGRLRATTEVGEAVAAADVTVVLVPTPSEPDGRFSLRHVLAVAEQAGEALRVRALGPGAPRPVVAISSTVMPGDTGGPVREQLEKASGLACGPGFGLCYNPAFVALGSVLRDFTAPDFVLVGESDPEAGASLAALHGRVCRNGAPVQRMSLVDAEVVKLAVNTFVTTKISFANTLASLCERLPGADAEVVARTLGLDRRIGERCLAGGTPYGGPCFPRDNHAFAALARAVGAPPLLAEATDAVNRARAGELADLARAALPPGGTVGILGLAYKPGTAVVEESAGVHVALALARAGVAVVCHDPAALPAAGRWLAEAGGGRVAVAPTAQACVAAADVVLLATPWEEYRRLGPETLARPGRPRVVIDAWRAWPGLAAVAGVRYRPAGRPEAGAAAGGGGAPAGGGEAR
jgi:UDPglucose 6-dehydrogenase